MNHETFPQTYCHSYMVVYSPKLHPSMFPSIYSGLNMCHHVQSNTYVHTHPWVKLVWAYQTNFYTLLHTLICESLIPIFGKHFTWLYMPTVHRDLNLLISEYRSRDQSLLLLKIEVLTQRMYDAFIMADVIQQQIVQHLYYYYFRHLYNMLIDRCLLIIRFGTVTTVGHLSLTAIS